MRARSVPMIAMVAVLVLSGEAAAADARMVLRGGAARIGTTGAWTGDLLMTEGTDVTKLTADSTNGAQVSLEYRFTQLIGGEVCILQGTHDVTASEIELSFPREVKFGQVTEWPILLGANFHVTRDKKVDLYLGPVIGWVIWGDLKPSAAAQEAVAFGPITMRDDFAWGVNLGMDVPFARHWAFNVDFRLLDYGARTDSPPLRTVLGEDVTIPIKPLIATAGLALRW